MRVVARFYDPKGTEFTFDEVFYDSVGNVFLDEQKKLPIPFYLADENASFDRYEITDLPALRSRLEARLWPRLVERGLAFPDANARIDLDGVRFEVDFVWHERMLVVETDGEEAHATRSAFQRDRWRDQLLQAAGYRVMRVTWHQLEREPEQVVSRICSALES